MKLYCKVENNTVMTPPSVLHPSLQLKSDFELLDLGWYVVEQLLPETFDERFEVMDLSYDILPYKVVVTYTKHNKTDEELQEFTTQLRIVLTEKQQFELEQTSMMTDTNSQAYWHLTEPERIKWQAYKEQLENLFNTNTPIWEIIFPESPNQPTPQLPNLPPLPNS